MPRQQSIPGTEPDHPEVADAIERWLEACERKKAASEAAAEADDVVVIKMLELGVQHYPYTDPESGSGSIASSTPRRAASPWEPGRSRLDQMADEPSVSESTPPVEQVTHRKVSRAKAERDIAAARPKREKKRDPNADAVDGALRPARDWDADDADARS
jgi:hypothetical protein